MNTDDGDKGDMGRTNDLFNWDTGRVIATALVGHLAASFDTVMSRVVVILTVAILAIKLYRMLFKAEKHDPRNDRDDYEGD